MILSPEERNVLREFCDMFELSQKADNWPRFADVLLQSWDDEKAFPDLFPSFRGILPVLRKMVDTDPFVMLSLGDIRAVGRRIGIAEKSAGSGDGGLIQAQLDKQMSNCVAVVKYIVATVYL